MITWALSLLILLSLCMHTHCHIHLIVRIQQDAIILLHWHYMTSNASLHGWRLRTINSLWMTCIAYTQADVALLLLFQPLCRSKDHSFARNTMQKLSPRIWNTECWGFVESVYTVCTWLMRWPDELSAKNSRIRSYIATFTARWIARYCWC